MDSMITAAAQALAAGNPLGALDRVALRDDAPALALRGIAMAQLGDLVRARALVKRAQRAFAPKEVLARARCVVAEAEIALASRELGWPVKALETARVTLEHHGDRVNAAHARYLQIRRLLLIGQLDEAQQLLAGLDPGPLPPALRATHELVLAGIAIRRLQSHAAREALNRAGQAAGQAGIAALMAEVQHAVYLLDAPAARLIAQGEVGRCCSMMLKRCSVQRHWWWMPAGTLCAVVACRCRSRRGQSCSCSPVCWLRRGPPTLSGKC